MKSLRKFFSIIMMGVMVISTVSLGGCSFYTKEDLAEYTKERLREEYGEEFEIKTVVDGSHTIAYPVNNPDLLFETTYVISNDNGFNTYLQEIVGSQYKVMVEEKLANFEYDYYVDVNVDRTGDFDADIDITIEELDELSGFINKPSYKIYLSCDALSYSDEELYKLFESIVYMHDCGISIYFITNDDINIVLKNYSSFPTMQSDGYYYLDYTRKYKRISSSISENGQWNMNFKDFKEIMKEVRSNELYG